MTGCASCGGFGMHHDPVAHGADEQQQRVMAERASIARGICPRSHQPIMPGGSLRPSCSFCDCGEDES